MRKQRNRAVTLFELITAIVLLSVIILGVTSIERFSRSHVISSDRRAKVQNQLYYLIEHMQKKIMAAVGNERVNAANNVIDTTSAVNTEKWVRVYVQNPATGVNYWIAYCFYNSGVNKYQILYCDQCPDKACTSGTWKMLSNKIVEFSVTKPGGSGFLSDNFITVQIKGRFDPMQNASIDNPEATMTTRIKMPAVSVN